MDCKRHRIIILVIFRNSNGKTSGMQFQQTFKGMTALDIGCNAGFYSFELAKRGADVLGIHLDPHYLKQASWAADAMGA